MEIAWIAIGAAAALFVLLLLVALATSVLRSLAAPSRSSPRFPLLASPFGVGRRAAEEGMADV